MKNLEFILCASTRCDMVDKFNTLTTYLVWRSIYYGIKYKVMDDVNLIRVSIVRKDVENE